MTYDVYLAHHGILGMKWGIRRYQNADGTLTAAGRSRYGVDDNSVNRSSSKTSTSKKMTHEEKLVSKYLQEGMSREDALLAAHKRVKMEKILAVTAGVTVAALAVYAGKKMWDTRVDKFIPKDTLLHNISRHSDKGIDDAFYAAFKDKDRLKYRGLYGRQLKMFKPGAEVFDTEIKANSKLKIASQNSAIKTLSSLVKNQEYKDALDRHLSDVSGKLLSADSRVVVDRGLKSLRSGKIDKNVYEALNIAATYHGPEYDRTIKGFYDALKSRGYDAIMDVNDRKYSGYRASKPIIVFGGNKNLSVSGRTKLSELKIGSDAASAEDFLGKQNIRSENVKALKEFASGYSPFLGAIGAVSAYAKTKEHNAIVSDYIEAHPATKLSYNEILDNYYGRK